MKSKSSCLLKIPFTGSMLYTHSCMVLFLLLLEESLNTLRSAWTKHWLTKLFTTLFKILLLLLMVKTLSTKLACSSFKSTHFLKTASKWDMTTGPNSKITSRWMISGNLFTTFSTILEQCTLFLKICTITSKMLRLLCRSLITNQLVSKLDIS